MDRLNLFADECGRNPFKGTEKPEPLKGALQGGLSSRITTADRLVYRVAGKDDDQRLEIAQCRFQYCLGLRGLRALACEISDLLALATGQDHHFIAVRNNEQVVHAMHRHANAVGVNKVAVTAIQPNIA